MLWGFLRKFPLVNPTCRSSLSSAFPGCFISDSFLSGSATNQTFLAPPLTSLVGYWSKRLGIQAHHLSSSNGWFPAAFHTSAGLQADAATSTAVARPAGASGPTAYDESTASLKATVSPNKNILTAGRQQRTPPPPWTPTRMLKKRNFLPRRMGHLMEELEKEHAEKVASEKSFPEFGPGNVLELKLVVPENRRRPAVFKGICIARRNRGWRTNFTLLNAIPGGGPVERTFPLYSPHILEMKVLEQRKIRRAKLYYLRNRNPREFRV